MTAARLYKIVKNKKMYVSKNWKWNKEGNPIYALTLKKNKAYEFTDAKEILAFEDRFNFVGKKEMSKFFIERYEIPQTYEDKYGVTNPMTLCENVAKLKAAKEHYTTLQDNYNNLLLIDLDELPSKQREQVEKVIKLYEEEMEIVSNYIKENDNDNDKSVV